MDSSNALQKAIFDRLAGDAALTALIGPAGIFDYRQTGKPMPYVVIAAIETRDFGPETEEHIVALEAWAESDGRKQVQEIAALVRSSLHDAALALAGVTLVNLRHTTTRVRREPKSKTFVAEMTFRAVTE